MYTQARRLNGVEATARDAIALMLDMAPDSFDVSVEPVLESGATAIVEQARISRIEADRMSRAASDQLRDAVDRLAEAGLTVRDIGTILGLSHQRVAQLTRVRGS